MATPKVAVQRMTGRLGREPVDTIRPRHPVRETRVDQPFEHPVQGDPIDRFGASNVFDAPLQIEMAERLMRIEQLGQHPGARISHPRPVRANLAAGLIEAVWREWRHGWGKILS